MTARVGDRVVAEDALPVRVAHVEVECPATEILALEIVPTRTKVQILNIHEKKSRLLCCINNCLNVFVENFRDVHCEEVLLEDLAPELQRAVG